MRGAQPSKKPRRFSRASDFNPPIRALPAWRRSTGSWRASIQNLSQSVLTPRFPRLVPPAGGKMASGPLLADHFQLPCLKQSDGQHRFKQGSRARFHRRTGTGFTTGLPRKRGWLERIAGPNVASPGKGLRHGKFSSFHIVEQLLHAGGQRHAPAVAIAGRALMSRAKRLVTTRATVSRRALK